MIMRRSEGNTNRSNAVARQNDRGSAIVIALFVMALIGVFVVLALSRSASEATAMLNEGSEGRTFYAAQGSLEAMTRNFNKIFEVQLNPADEDIDAVRDAVVPAMAPQYTFAQEVDQTSPSDPVVLSGGPYSGLYAIRDTWRLRTTATDAATDTQVQLTRDILNNRIPIFQFGIFYDDDLELFRPPLFSFGGRVHSNRHFFVSPGGEGVYFDSRVTAAGHIITETWRNGFTGDIANNQTFIKNASRVDKQLLPARGSVLNTTSGAADNIFASDPDMPPSKINPNWLAQSAVFDGNLQAEVKELKLPLTVGTNTDLVEMIRRGRELGDLLTSTAPVTTADVDSKIMRAERFANKSGIRVSLADSKAKLPGCASGTGVTPVTGACGVRLDGPSSGQVAGAMPAPTPSATPERARGYQPKPMKLNASDTTWGYQSTRTNGERLFTGGTREVWIKIETVVPDESNGGVIVTDDITEEILSLGLTEQALSLGNFSINGYNHTSPNNCVNVGCNLVSDTPQTAAIGTDSRSIIKLQRFLIPGPPIGGGSNVLRSATGTAPALNYQYNAIARYGNVDSGTKILNGCLSGCTTTAPNNNTGIGLEQLGHLKRATVGGTANIGIVPFPIEMFDSREGLHYDDRNTGSYPVANYGTIVGNNYPRISRNGVMSLVDVDIANLRRFLRGDFDGLFPDGGTGRVTAFTAAHSRAMTSADVPQKSGWVLYVSDRRGDADFDGEFDMEDVYGAGSGNDGTTQKGEDINRNGSLDTAYGTEAERYRNNTAFPDAAAVTDHVYFRRGVRLINGTVLPGIYDSATASNTRGLTVASENGVYVKGNYNSTGVTNVPATGNTLYSEFSPFNTPLHIPASIVADAVTILSNSKYDLSPSGLAIGTYTDGWNDAKSFTSPYDEGGRLALTTQVRFAMISGDTIASKDAAPNQGGISPRLNGGVHNFKRFLERWTGQRLDYAGSLINLWNSRNNNGSFKCCNTVYDPPRRNWVFDSTFLDPSRLPPATPYFQYVQTTGFQRTAD